jgi:hypothetical protein
VDEIGPCSNSRKSHRQNTWLPDQELILSFSLLHKQTTGSQFSPPLALVWSERGRTALETVGGVRFEFKQSGVGADRVMGQGPKAEGRWALRAFALVSTVKIKFLCRVIN